MILTNFEIKANFSYRFVYKFDKQSSFTNSIEVNNQSYFTFMLDNQQTVGHRTLILRFRSRVYSSGCYYLNKENEWKEEMDYELVQKRIFLKLIVT